MRTYSALRSQVHTVDVALPAPRPTDTSISVRLRYSAARGAASSYGRPSSNNTGGADGDGGARKVKGDARAAGGRDQAAPVGIAPVDRRLDERRVGDRLGCPARLAGRRRPRHSHRDQLGRALTATHDAE